MTTTHGEFTVEKSVLAAGSWSENLGKMLDLRVPILGTKGYSMLLPRANPHPKSLTYLIERKVAVNPHKDALRISGTLELVKNDFSINQRRVSAGPITCTTVIDRNGRNCRRYDSGATRAEIATAVVGLLNEGTRRAVSF